MLCSAITKMNRNGLPARERETRKNPFFHPKKGIFPFFSSSSNGERGKKKKLRCSEYSWEGRILFGTKNSSRRGRERKGRSYNVPRTSIQVLYAKEYAVVDETFILWCWISSFWCLPKKWQQQPTCKIFYLALLLKKNCDFAYISCSCGKITRAKIFKTKSLLGTSSYKNFPLSQKVFDFILFLFFAKLPSPFPFPFPPFPPSGPRQPIPFQSNHSPSLPKKAAAPSSCPLELSWVDRRGRKG